MRHDSCQLEAHHDGRPHTDSAATSRMARFGVYCIFDLGLLTRGRAQKTTTGTWRGLWRRRW